MSQVDNWNATLYDNSHAFISTFGENLVDMLAPTQGEKILDLGCGTGDLAEKLTEKGAIITGIDQSSNMITQAQEKYPHIDFQVKNANNLDFYEAFDAVFSNAALHWIKTPQDVIRSVYNALKPGGRFVAEFGGYGNIAPILKAILRQAEEEGEQISNDTIPWYFPSIGEYTSLLEEQGFLVTYALLHDRPTALAGEEGLRNWLSMFTGDFFSGIDTEKQAKIITAIEDELKPILFDGKDWIAPYRRIRVCCIK